MVYCPRLLGSISELVHVVTPFGDFEEEIEIKLLLPFDLYWTYVHISNHV